MGPSAATPQLPQTPSAPAPPPLFGMQQPGGGQKKPKAQSQQTTFLGTQAMANPTNTGQKTLIGQ